MQRPPLKLVSGQATAEPCSSQPGRLAGSVRNRRAAAGLGAILLALGAAATFLGADAARRPVDPRARVRQALERSLRSGLHDARVRQSLVALRREVGRRPVDARTRMAYATLLHGLALAPEDREAAAFHAERSAMLAPVTVPVVSAAAAVLAAAHHVERALALTRRMFAYDPRAAARVLLSLSPHVSTQRVEQGLPDVPQAWIAWAWQLRDDGRPTEADAALDGARARWPANRTVLRELAARAHARRDWTGLAALLPASVRFPEDALSAWLFAYRARGRAGLGDIPGARADVARATRLTSDGAVLLLAGDSLHASGDEEGAGALWMRCLYRMPETASASARLAPLVRLARLEEQAGRPGRALRFWRQAKAVDPGHAEATRRLGALTGGSS